MFKILTISLVLLFPWHAGCQGLVMDQETPIENKTIVGLHLASFHSATGYNDINPGIYVELPNHLTVGHYYNSNFHESTYVAYTYGWTKEIDLTLGLTTGYQIYKYTPLLVPSYKFLNIYDSFALRIAFIPRFFGVVQANVLHAMVERPF